MEGSASKKCCAHLKTHLPDKKRVQLKCSVSKCTKRYWRRSELKRHVAVEHSSTSKIKFNCDQCSKEYSTKEHLKSHDRQIHSGSPKKFGCNLCDVSFMSKIGRDNHIVVVHTGEKAFKCRKCPSKFASESNFRSHQIMHSVNTPHKCQSCSKQFKRPGDLKSHIHRIHSQRTKNFQCSICQKTFFTKWNLTAHLRTHSQEVEQYSCYFCPKAFRRPIDQDDHLRIHTQEKPFFCYANSCQYSTSRSSSLRAHQKLHHPPIGGQGIPGRIYLCYFCSKTFSQSRDLVIHLRSHTLETPFTCAMCQRPFKDNLSMKRHIFSHTKEKPFKCPHCQKCFSFNSTLKLHIATTHLHKKRFFCELCSHSTYRKGDMNKHQLSQSHHLLTNT